MSAGAVRAAVPPQLLDAPLVDISVAGPGPQQGASTGTEIIATTVGGRPLPPGFPPLLLRSSARRSDSSASASRLASALVSPRHAHAHAALRSVPIVDLVLEDETNAALPSSSSSSLRQPGRRLVASTTRDSGPDSESRPSRYGESAGATAPDGQRPGRGSSGSGRPSLRMLLSGSGSLSLRRLQGRGAASGSAAQTTSAAAATAPQATATARPSRHASGVPLPMPLHIQSARGLGGGAGGDSVIIIADRRLRIVRAARSLQQIAALAGHGHHGAIGASPPPPRHTSSKLSSQQASSRFDDTGSCKPPIVDVCYVDAAAGEAPPPNYEKLPLQGSISLCFRRLPAEALLQAADGQQRHGHGPGRNRHAITQVGPPSPAVASSGSATAPGAAAALIGSAVDYQWDPHSLSGRYEPEVLAAVSAPASTREHQRHDDDEHGVHRDVVLTAPFPWTASVERGQASEQAAAFATVPSRAPSHRDSPPRAALAAGGGAGGQGDWAGAVGDELEDFGESDADAVIRSGGPAGLLASTCARYVFPRGLRVLTLSAIRGDVPPAPQLRGFTITDEEGRRRLGVAIAYYRRLPHGATPLGATASRAANRTRTDSVAGNGAAVPGAPVSGLRVDKERVGQADSKVAITTPPTRTPNRTREGQVLRRQSSLSLTVAPELSTETTSSTSLRATGPPAAAPGHDGSVVAGQVPPAADSGSSGSKLGRLFRRLRGRAPIPVPVPAPASVSVPQPVTSPGSGSAAGAPSRVSSAAALDDSESDAVDAPSASSSSDVLYAQEALCVVSTWPMLPVLSALLRWAYACVACSGAIGCVPSGGHEGIDSFAGGDAAASTGHRDEDGLPLVLTPAMPPHRVAAVMQAVLGPLMSSEPPPGHQLGEAARLLPTSASSAAVAAASDAPPALGPSVNIAMHWPLLPSQWLRHLLQAERLAASGGPSAMLPLSSQTVGLEAANSMGPGPGAAAGERKAFSPTPVPLGRDTDTNTGSQRSLRYGISDAQALPPFADGHVILLRCLTPTHIVECMKLLLLEQRVIVHSQHAPLLLPATQALLSLLFPLTWAGAYIPVVDRVLMDIVDCPCAFLVGIPTPLLPMRLPPDVFVVDLDRDRVTCGYGGAPVVMADIMVPAAEAAVAYGGEPAGDRRLQLAQLPGPSARVAAGSGGPPGLGEMGQMDSAALARASEALRMGVSAPLQGGLPVSDQHHRRYSSSAAATLSPHVVVPAHLRRHISGMDVASTFAAALAADRHDDATADHDEAAANAVGLGSQPVSPAATSFTGIASGADSIADARSLAHIREERPSGLQARTSPNASPTYTQSPSQRRGGAGSAGALSPAPASDPLAHRWPDAFRRVRVGDSDDDTASLAASASASHARSLSVVSTVGPLQPGQGNSRGFGRGSHGVDISGLPLAAAHGSGGGHWRSVSMPGGPGDLSAAAAEAAAAEAVIVQEPVELPPFIVAFLTVRLTDIAAAAGFRPGLGATKRAYAAFPTAAAPELLPLPAPLTNRDPASASAAAFLNSTSSASHCQPVYLQLEDAQLIEAQDALEQRVAANVRDAFLRAMCAMLRGYRAHAFWLKASDVAREATRSRTREQAGRFPGPLGLGIDTHKPLRASPPLPPSISPPLSAASPFGIHSTTGSEASDALFQFDGDRDGGLEGGFGIGPGGLDDLEVKLRLSPAAVPMVDTGAIRSPSQPQPGAPLPMPLAAASRILTSPSRASCMMVDAGTVTSTATASVLHPKRSAMLTLQVPRPRGQSQSSDASAPMIELNSSRCVPETPLQMQAQPTAPQAGVSSGAPQPEDGVQRDSEPPMSQLPSRTGPATLQQRFRAAHGGASGSAGSGSGPLQSARVRSVSFMTPRLQWQDPLQWRQRPASRSPSPEAQAASSGGASATVLPLPLPRMWPSPDITPLEPQPSSQAVSSSQAGIPRLPSSAPVSRRNRRTVSDGAAQAVDVAAAQLSHAAGAGGRLAALEFASSAARASALAATPLTRMQRAVPAARTVQQAAGVAASQPPTPANGQLARLLSVSGISLAAELVSDMTGSLSSSANTPTTISGAPSRVTRGGSASTAVIPFQSSHEVQGLGGGEGIAIRRLSRASGVNAGANGTHGGPQPGLSNRPLPLFASPRLSHGRSIHLGIGSSSHTLLSSGSVTARSAAPSSSPLRASPEATAPIQAEGRNGRSSTDSHADADAANDAATSLQGSLDLVFVFDCARFVDRCRDPALQSLLVQLVQTQAFVSWLQGRSWSAAAQPQHIGSSAAAAAPSDSKQALRRKQHSHVRLYSSGDAETGQAVPVAVQATAAPVGAPASASAQAATSASAAAAEQAATAQRLLFFDACQDACTTQAAPFGPPDALLADLGKYGKAAVAAAQAAVAQRQGAAAASEGGSGRSAAMTEKRSQQFPRGLLPHLLPVASGGTMTVDLARAAAPGLLHLARQAAAGNSRQPATLGDSTEEGLAEVNSDGRVAPGLVAPSPRATADFGMGTVVVAAGRLGDFADPAGGRPKLSLTPLVPLALTPPARMSGRESRRFNDHLDEIDTGGRRGEGKRDAKLLGPGRLKAAAALDSEAQYSQADLELRDRSASVLSGTSGLAVLPLAVSGSSGPGRRPSRESTITTVTTSGPFPASGTRPANHDHRHASTASEGASARSESSSSSLRGSSGWLGRLLGRRGSVSSSSSGSLASDTGSSSAGSAARMASRRDSSASASVADGSSKSQTNLNGSTASHAASANAASAHANANGPRGAPGSDAAIESRSPSSSTMAGAASAGLIAAQQPGGGATSNFSQAAPSLALIAPSRVDVPVHSPKSQPLRATRDSELRASPDESGDALEDDSDASLRLHSLRAAVSDLASVLGRQVSKAAAKEREQTTLAMMAENQSASDAALSLSSGSSASYSGGIDAARTLLRLGMSPSHSQGVAAKSSLKSGSGAAGSSSGPLRWTPKGSLAAAAALRRFKSHEPEGDAEADARALARRAERQARMRALTGSSAHALQPQPEPASDTQAADATGGRPAPVMPLAAAAIGPMAASAIMTGQGSARATSAASVAVTTHLSGAVAALYTGMPPNLSASASTPITGSQVLSSGSEAVALGMRTNGERQEDEGRLVAALAQGEPDAAAMAIMQCASVHQALLLALGLQVSQQRQQLVEQPTHGSNLSRHWGLEAASGVVPGAPVAAASHVSVMDPQPRFVSVIGPAYTDAAADSDSAVIGSVQAGQCLLLALAALMALMRVTADYGNAPLSLHAAVRAVAAAGLRAHAAGAVDASALAQLALTLCAISQLQQDDSTAAEVDSRMLPSSGSCHDATGSAGAGEKAGTATGSSAARPGEPAMEAAPTTTESGTWSTPAPRNHDDHLDDHRDVHAPLPTVQALLQLARAAENSLGIPRRTSEERMGVSDSAPEGYTARSSDRRASPAAASGSADVKACGSGSSGHPQLNIPPIPGVATIRRLGGHKPSESPQQHAGHPDHLGGRHLESQAPVEAGIHLHGIALWPAPASLACPSCREGATAPRGSRTGTGAGLQTAEPATVCSSGAVAETAVLASAEPILSLPRPRSVGTDANAAIRAESRAKGLSSPAATTAATGRMTGNTPKQLDDAAHAAAAHAAVVADDSEQSLRRRSRPGLAIDVELAEAAGNAPLVLAADVEEAADLSDSLYLRSLSNRSRSTRAASTATTGATSHVNFDASGSQAKAIGSFGCCPDAGTAAAAAIAEQAGQSAAQRLLPVAAAAAASGAGTTTGIPGVAPLAPDMSGRAGEISDANSLADSESASQSTRSQTRSEPFMWRAACPDCGTVGVAMRPVVEWSVLSAVHQQQKQQDPLRQSETAPAAKQPVSSHWSDSKSGTRVSEPEPKRSTAATATAETRARSSRSDCCCWACSLCGQSGHGEGEGADDARAAHRDRDGDHHEPTTGQWTPVRRCAVLLPAELVPRLEELLSRGHGSRCGPEERSSLLGLGGQPNAADFPIEGGHELEGDGLAALMTDEDHHGYSHQHHGSVGDSRASHREAGSSSEAQIPIAGGSGYSGSHLWTSHDACSLPVAVQLLVSCLWWWKRLQLPPAALTALCGAVGTASGLCASTATSPTPASRRDAVMMIPPVVVTGMGSLQRTAIARAAQQLYKQLGVAVNAAKAMQLAMQASTTAAARAKQAAEVSAARRHRPAEPQVQVAREATEGAGEAGVAGSGAAFGFVGSGPGSGSGSLHPAGTSGAAQPAQMPAPAHVSSALVSCLTSLERALLRTCAVVSKHAPAELVQVALTTVPLTSPPAAATAVHAAAASHAQFHRFASGRQHSRRQQQRLALELSANPALTLLLPYLAGRDVRGAVRVYLALRAQLREQQRRLHVTSSSVRSAAAGGTGSRDGVASTWAQAQAEKRSARKASADTSFAFQVVAQHQHRHPSQQVAQAQAGADSGPTVEAGHRHVESPHSAASSASSASSGSASDAHAAAGRFAPTSAAPLAPLLPLQVAASSSGGAGGGVGAELSRSEGAASSSAAARWAMQRYAVFALPCHEAIAAVAALHVPALLQELEEEGGAAATCTRTSATATAGPATAAAHAGTLSGSISLTAAAAPSPARASDASLGLGSETAAAQLGRHTQGQTTAAGVKYAWRSALPIQPRTNDFGDLPPAPFTGATGSEQRGERGVGALALASGSAGVDSLSDVAEISRCIAASVSQLGSTVGFAAAKCRSQRSGTQEALRFRAPRHAATQLMASRHAFEVSVGDALIELLLSAAGDCTGRMSDSAAASAEDSRLARACARPRSASATASEFLDARDWPQGTGALLCQDLIGKVPL